MHSTLEIQTSIASDFGEYNCSVKNSHGSASLMIILKPESKLKINHHSVIAFFFGIPIYHHVNCVYIFRKSTLDHCLISSYRRNHSYCSCHCDNDIMSSLFFFNIEKSKEARPSPEFGPSKKRK